MADSTILSFSRQDKNFMWLIDHKDFSVIDILEISDYSIIIDEETNSTSQILVNKKTDAKANDIVIFKKNNTIIYWGIIEKIENNSGNNDFGYICKYFTNMFDEKIALQKNINSSDVEEGYYRIVSVANHNGNIAVKESSTDANALVQIWSINNLKNGIWQIIRSGQHYKIKNVNSDLYLDVKGQTYTTMGKELCQTSTGANFDFVYNQDGYYNIVFSGYTYSNKQIMVSVDNTNGIAEGTKLQNWYKDEENDPSCRRFYLEKTTEPIIWKTGIEDFIKGEIERNFINSDDSFVNKTYLQVIAETHTTKDVLVSNVENGIYNLHTYMNNCTQNYNVFYEFKIDTTGQTPKFKIIIKIKDLDKEIIDTNAMSITDYEETFESDIISKVRVLTSSKVYELFLKTNRETTEDKNDQDRADGKSETIYTENYDDAKQAALDVINSNRYNHNISFSLKDRYLQIGTPISIKTKQSSIYDTYISSVNITNNSFYYYQCGNIRTTLIEKLLKERK